MIISYLKFIFNEFIFQKYISYLFNLVGFGFTAIGLKIDDFFNSFFPENMMTAFYPDFERSLKSMLLSELPDSILITNFSDLPIQINLQQINRFF